MEECRMEWKNEEGFRIWWKENEGRKKGKEGKKENYLIGGESKNDYISGFPGLGC